MLDVLGLAGAAADLGQQQVNAEGGVLVVEEALELGDLVAQHVGGVADAADDAETAAVSNAGGQLGPGSHVHAGEQDGVLDLEQISDGRADLLCGNCQRLVLLLLWPAPAPATQLGAKAPDGGDDVRGEAIVGGCGWVMRTRWAGYKDTGRWTECWEEMKTRERQKEESVGGVLNPTSAADDAEDQRLLASLFGGHMPRLGERRGALPCLA